MPEDAAATHPHRSFAPAASAPARPRPGVPGPGSTPVVCAVAALAALLGALGVIGADAIWLVPLGGRIARGALPAAIPYATAPTRGWHDVPAGSELVFWSLFHAFGGLRGLVLAQAAAAAAAFGLLARGLAREAPAGTALVVSVLALVGSLPNVVVVNASLFSLVLFAALLVLLESEMRAPSGRIWLAVPLIALWGNLHGEVLAGFGLLACYLLVERGRRDPWLALALLASAAAALCANPALWQTPRYYSSVFHSQVARQGSGLWAPLGTGGFDLILIGVAAILVALSLLGGVRVHLWEAIALLGLAAATAHVARSGTWFLLLAAYPAARSLRLEAPRTRMLGLVAAAAAAAAIALLIRGPADPGSTALADRAARDGPVLAEAVLGQQVALAGGRVWVDNPIDAFRPADQSLYLDWLAGKPGGEEALAHVAEVLVEPHSRPGELAARNPRLIRLARSAGGVLYRVRAAS